jgi:glycosyltransferase involved in cell wall biosynthesis
MRILWLSGSRVAGGAERATLQLMALLRDRGHDVAVAAPVDSRLQALCREQGIAIRPAALGAALKLRSWPAAAALLRDVAPDVALATGADEWVWSCLSPRSGYTRLVLARHMALPLSQRVRWLAARRADAVIAVSHAVRESLGRTIPEPRLHTIYNPVRFEPRAALPTAEQRGAARRRLGLPPDGRWVGFFGGADPNKGVDDVAAALRPADGGLGSVRLLLCGRRDARLPAAQLASRLRLNGRLYDLGEIDDVREALTAADAIVMATHSRLSEALPAILIEAMACGTPVLAYASGGMAEVIGADERAGRLARPDDAGDLARILIETLADPAAAERRAAVALQRVRELFDPRLAADRYERLFTVLRTQPSAGPSPTP